MATLGAALARGLAGYMGGRQEREQEDFRRAQLAQQQARQAKLDEENRLREAARMDMAAKSFEAAQAERERQAQREAAQDSRSDFEGGYRPVTEARQQGGALETLGAGGAALGGAGGFSLPAAAMQSMGEAMRTQREAFSRNGVGMAKVGESMREREQRLANQQREGEALQQQQARAAERAEERAFQSGENAKNRAATLAGINARMAGSGAGQRPAPRTLPMGVEQAISENASVLNAIGQAEQMIMAGKGKGAFGRGMGVKRTLGLERWGATPEDTELAAVVGNVASQQIKLRSGAAVTASEWPRLRPFLPVLDGPGADDTATVLRKLQKIREIIAEETNTRADYYESQGYSVPQIPGRRPPNPDVRRDRPASPMDDPEFVNFLRSRGITP